MVQDSAQSPRIGQKVAVENAGIPLVTGATMPPAPWDGLLVYRMDISVFQVYSGDEGAWLDPGFGSGSNKTFFGASEPAADNLGDLWIKTPGNYLHYWNGNDWILSVDPVAEAAAVDASNALNAANKSIYNTALANATQHATHILTNPKSYFHYQTSMPQGKEGDLWYEPTSHAFRMLTNMTWETVTVPSPKLIAHGTLVAFYLSNTRPSGASAGDLLLRGGIKDRFGTEWVTATGNDAIMIDEFVAVRTAYAQAIIDQVTDTLGELTTWFRAADPASTQTVAEGDVWFKTDVNLVFRRDGAKWVQVTDPSLVESLNRAADARSIADGKIVSYRSADNDPPTAPSEGDLWTITNKGNLIRRWDGGAWIDLPSGVGAIAPDAVGNDEIAPDAVGNNEIAQDAVGNSQIADGAVGRNELDTPIKEQIDSALTSDGLPPTSAPGVEVVNGVSGTIFLKITPPSNPDPITGYTIWMSKVSSFTGSESTLYNSNAPALASLQGLDTDVDYYFYVAANDPDGTGPKSAQVTGKSIKIDPSALTQDVLDAITDAGNAADAAQMDANQALQDALDAFTAAGVADDKAVNAQSKADAAATPAQVATAKQEALNEAATDAQDKADTAKTAAENAAALTADGKISAAQAQILIDAAEAAQTKATKALSDAKTFASGAANQALADAKADSTQKDAALKTATLTAADLAATSKRETSESLLATAAANDAQTKATAAKNAAEAAAKTYADQVSAGEGSGALAAAKTYAEQKANEAREAAKTAAALDATAKKEAAEATAATDASNKADAALAAAKAATDRLASRGTDLIVNGTGSMGDNTNFERFTFDSSDSPPGAAGSFVTPESGGAYNLTDVLPVSVTKNFELSFWARQTGTGDGYTYTAITPYDSDMHSISPSHIMYDPGTLTTLAQDLKVGDTVIHLSDVTPTPFYGSTGRNGQTYQRSIIWWDYVDGSGKLWGPETYSRNLSGFDLWAHDAVDNVAKTITLRAPYSGPLKPAGTKLSGGSSGSTAMYPPGQANFVVPDEWTFYTSTVRGVAENGGAASFSNGWPISAAYMVLGWFANRPPQGGTEPGTQMAVAGVSFSDASAAQDTADSKASPAEVAAAKSQAIVAAKVESDKKGKVIIQNAAPAAADRLPQNLWIDTTGGKNIPKKWTSGSTWVAVQDASIQVAADAAVAAQNKANLAFTNASTAQDTANGKNSNTFSGASGKPPTTGRKEGDIHSSVVNGTAVKQWVFTSGDWLERKIDGATLTNIDATTINTGFLNVAVLIDTDALHANKIMSDTITSTQIASYTIKSDNIATNQIMARHIQTDAITANMIQSDALNAKTIQNGRLFTAMLSTASYAGNRSFPQRIEMGETGYGDPVDEIRMFNNSSVISLRHISGFSGTAYFSLENYSTGSTSCSIFNSGVINSGESWLMIGRGQPTSGGAKLKFVSTSIQARNYNDTGYSSIQASSFTQSSYKRFKKNVVSTAPDVVEVLKGAGLRKWEWNEEFTGLPKLRSTPLEEILPPPENKTRSKTAAWKKEATTKKNAEVAAAQEAAQVKQYGLIADELPEFLQEGDGYSVTAVTGFLWETLKNVNARVEALESKPKGTK